MNNSRILPLLLLLALLLAACNPAAAPTATSEPTSTEVAPSPTPTNTSTPEPTATATVTPTMDPDFKEYRASWFEENLAIAQSGDPNVSITTAACVYNADDECVQAIDYCPEASGLPCVGFMVISPLKSFPVNDPTSAWYNQPGVKIGKYATTLWRTPVFAQESLFVTDKELEVFLCTADYPGQTYLDALESLILVNQPAWDALYAGGEGLFTPPLREYNSVEECGGR